MSLLLVFDFFGTIAFAISGALTAVHRRMDLFGINILAIATATGGGILRDIIIGDTPPMAFRSPTNVAIAAVTANIVFIVLKIYYGKKPDRKLPHSIEVFYDETMFGFDTLGLASFTVEGVMIGVNAGYADNLFLLTFIAFITGVGGGVLRDLFAVKMPDIFRKHVYALAVIAGGLITSVLATYAGKNNLAMVVGFLAVVIIRILAKHFEWDLPKV